MGIGAHVKASKETMTGLRQKSGTHQRLGHAHTHNTTQRDTTPHDAPQHNTRQHNAATTSTDQYIEAESCQGTMQLLYSSIIPVVEFASVSLLLKDGSDESAPSSGSMGESIIVASPLSTTTSAPKYLIELHDYLSSVYENAASSSSSSSSSNNNNGNSNSNNNGANNRSNNSSSNGNHHRNSNGIDTGNNGNDNGENTNSDKNDGMKRSIEQFGRDDATLLESSSQIFRSSQGHGMGLHYHVVQAKDFVRLCFGVLMGRYARGVTVESVSGVVICCGVAGLSTSYTSSALVNKIMSRMEEVASNMKRMGNVSDAEQSKTCYKALLSSLLVTEDEERRTNKMVDAELVRMVLDMEDESRRTGSRGRPAARSAVRSSLASEKITLAPTSSASYARMMEKRSAVLSVAEKETSLPPYAASGRERRTKIDLVKSKRSRKGLDLADLKAFEFGKDGRYDRDFSSTTQRKGPILTLSKRDTKQVPRPRPRPPPNPSTGPGAFDMFGQGDKEPTGGFPWPGIPANDVSPSNMNDVGNSSMSSSHALHSPNPSTTDSMQQHRGYGSSSDFDVFPVDSSAMTPSPVSMIPSTPTTGALTPVSRSSSMTESESGGRPLETDQNTGYPVSTTRSNSEDHNMFPIMPPPPPPHPPAPAPASHRTNESPSVTDSETNSSKGRLQVNIALNEDLTCTYRYSKLSSCTIEGVVQVQVRSDSQQKTPFFLLLRDPSRHIRMIQENRRYADDMTEALSDQNEDDIGVDYKFTISVPRADNYFPVMRYKCSNELRPVPIVSVKTFRLLSPRVLIHDS